MHVILHFINSLKIFVNVNDLLSIQKCANRSVFPKEIFPTVESFFMKFIIQYVKLWFQISNVVNWTEDHRNHYNVQLCHF